MVGHLNLWPLLGLLLLAQPAAAAYVGPVILDTGDCLSGGPIPPTPGTIIGSFPVNVQGGASYTIAAGDRCKLVKLTNAAAVAVTLPAAGANFPSGWMAFIESRGAGGLTITPATGTIEGAADFAVAQNNGVIVFSDGSNYHIWGTVVPLLGPLASLPNGTQYQMLRMGAVNPQWEDTPYDLGSFMPGVPPDSAIIRIGVPRAVLFPSGLPNAVCRAKAAATSSTTVNLNLIHAGASSAIGTMDWSAAGTVCSVTFGSDVTVVSGDLIEEAFPVSGDATLADIAITIPGIRQ
jgi:hypothetical protein